MKRQLILENGFAFVGEGFGATSVRKGEVVFNTSMTGYQEILSDPSYCDQIVTMTYPLIGNYGVNHNDFESVHPAIAGLIVKEATVTPSHWRSESTLHDMLKEKGIAGLAGIDTRRLTKMIRKHGTLKGKLCDEDENQAKVVEELNRKQWRRDQVSRVSTKIPYEIPGNGPRVVLVDFGMKKGILREINYLGCNVCVVPYNATEKDILQLHPDGVVLSNGPGDPKDIPESIETVKNLLGKVPLFGICLGHQLLALASGADTVKMGFGHRGANHPVKDLLTGCFYMTSQNHGYAVDPGSLSQTELEVTHIAINDQSIEGLRHKHHAAFSVQFHPEATPGPEDSQSLFSRFLEDVERHRKVGIPHA